VSDACWASRTGDPESSKPHQAPYAHLRQYVPARFVYHGNNGSPTVSDQALAVPQDCFPLKIASTLSAQHLESLQSVPRCRLQPCSAYLGWSKSVLWKEDIVRVHLVLLASAGMVALIVTLTTSSTMT